MQSLLAALTPVLKLEHPTQEKLERALVELAPNRALVICVDQAEEAFLPLSRALRKERQSKVHEELRRLPRDYRILLVLHYYRQMTYAEIAVALGKQLPAIKTAIFRAKRMLRDRIMGLENAEYRKILGSFS